MTLASIQVLLYKSGAVPNHSGDTFERGLDCARLDVMPVGGLIKGLMALV